MRDLLWELHWFITSFWHRVDLIAEKVFSLSLKTNAGHNSRRLRCILAISDPTSELKCFGYFKLVFYWISFQHQHNNTQHELQNLQTSIFKARKHFTWYKIVCFLTGSKILKILRKKNPSLAAIIDLMICIVKRKTAKFLHNGVKSRESYQCADTEEKYHNEKEARPQLWYR